MIRRRQAQVFSLSFLDCICCGFGAIILIFVISIGSRDKEKLETLLAVQRSLAEKAAALAAQEQPSPASEVVYPSAEQMDKFYVHLEQTLNETGFIIQQHPGIVMTKLRRLFTRARPEDAELNILRGVLTSIQRKYKQSGNDH